KGTEFSLAAVHRAQEVLFEQAGEKFLRQILRVRHIVAAPANEHVEWTPVDGAQGLECRLRAWRRALLGGQDPRPVGGREPPRPRIGWFIAVPRHGARMPDRQRTARAETCGKWPLKQGKRSFLAPTLGFGTKRRWRFRWRRFPCQEPLVTRE